jgi:hypothetical protein
MKLRQVQPLPQEDRVQHMLAEHVSKTAEFPDGWKNSTYDLLNELVMSYLNTSSSQ